MRALDGNAAGRCINFGTHGNLRRVFLEYHGLDRLGVDSRAFAAKSAFAPTLKMEPHRSANSPRRHVMRTAEGREKVVQRFFIRKVDDGDAGAPFPFVAVKQVVVADAEIEQVARGDARRVVIVTL